MSGALPGSRLLRIAERLFDRATLDGVVLPAIADLQRYLGVEIYRAWTANVLFVLIGLRRWRIRARTLSLEAGR